MTPADHAALSAQLARALGYYPESVEIHQNGSCHVYRCLAHRVPIYECWHLFDYRDPSVAMPVLEWLMREHGFEPWFFGTGWYVLHHSYDAPHCPTLHEAIARAAIAVADAKRQQVEQNEAREVLQP